MEYSPHHTAISVRDLDKTLDSYAIFGFKQVHQYDDEDKVGVKLRLNDYVLEIFTYKKNKDVQTLDTILCNNLDEIGVKHIGFTTDDVDAALSDLKAKDSPEMKRRS